MESNTKVSNIKVKVEDIGYEDFKSKENSVFEVTEEGAEKEVNEQENIQQRGRLHGLRPEREQRL